MNEFTAQDWILIIGAVGILINNVINNWRMNNKVDTINETAKVIEGHVNSATTKADERATAAAEREKALVETIAELRRNSALLAQALAIRDSGRVVRSTDAQAPVANVELTDVKKLDEIADNTADTTKAVRDLGDKNV